MASNNRDKDKNSLHQVSKKLLERKSHRRLLDNAYLKDANISLRWLRWLGYFMAFSGGTINTLGFFYFNKYTSHMSGEMANIANDLFLGNWYLALTATLAIIAFILGAAHSSWTIIWTKKHRFHSSYALSMWMEAFYLIIYGLLMGYDVLDVSSSNLTLVLFIFMCFIMGMHNTVLTILSKGIIRTTHMTGHITDIGIELSKVIYNLGLKKDDSDRLIINRPRFKLLFGIILGFLIGSFIGAWGFFELGYKVVLPIVIFLLVLGSTAIKHDIKLRSRLYRYKKKIKSRLKK